MKRAAFKSEEEFAEAFNFWQAKNLARAMRIKLRAKARRRAYVYLREKYPIDYGHYLSRALDEVYKEQEEKEAAK